MISLHRVRGEYIAHTPRHRALGLGSEPQIAAERAAELIRKHIGRSAPIVWGPREILDALALAGRWNLLSRTYSLRYSCPFPGCYLAEEHHGEHAFRD